MYAVVRTGSKQYRVEPGDVITIEKLDASVGEDILFEDVLLLNDGKRLIADMKELKGIKVSGKVIGKGKGRKIIVFKFKPKKGYKRKRGHRQEMTRVKIQDIILEKGA